MRCAMAFGTFDILHPGHLFYLKEAKKQAKKLIVVVARDKTVKKVKGKKPIHNERERLKLVKNLSIVDKAILGDKKDFLKPIFQHKPSIVALGYDHKIKISELKKKKIKCRIIRIKPYKPHAYKTSKIKRALVSCF